VSGANNKLKVIILAIFIYSGFYSYNMLASANQHCLFVTPGCVTDLKDAGFVSVIKLKAINDIMTVVMYVYASGLKAD